jgi:hypothetical protein
MSIPDTLAVSTSQAPDRRLRDCDDVPEDTATSSSDRLVARWSADTRPTASWNLEPR